MSGDSVSRREFLAATALGTLGIPAFDTSGDLGDGRARAASLRVQQRAGPGEIRLHVGTYTKDTASRGIHTLWMHRETGALRVGGLAAATVNPSFLALHPNGRVLYAVNETGDHEGKPSGAVTAFSVDQATGALTALGQVASGGADPCYIAVDRAGRVALVANYSGGSVAALPIDGSGRLGAAISLVKHEGRGPNENRQTSPHAHFVAPDPRNRFALAVDLGIDRVLIYAMDPRTGALSARPAAETRLRAGAGPRHLAFHPDGRRAYVLNELDSTLTALAWDAERGTLSETQTLGSRAANAPATNNQPADVHVARSGRFVYATNRGDDTLAVFSIDAPSGRLAMIQTEPTGGKWPRNFALDPTGRFLLVANERSDSIVVFRVDQETGRVAPTGHRATVPAPVCVRFGT